MMTAYRGAIGAMTIPARRPFAGLVFLLLLAASARPAAGASDYRLPAPPDQPLVVTQGNFDRDHAIAYGNSQFAFDFAVPGRSFPIVAARAGTVIGVRSDSDITCSGLNTKSDGTALPGCWAEANYVLIDHRDGTSMLYLHLQQNSVGVKPGDQVAQGQSLAMAGSTGFSFGVHLHMQLEETPGSNHDRKGWWWTSSRAFSFSDKSLVAAFPTGVPKRGSTAFHSDNSAPVQAAIQTPAPDFSSSGSSGSSAQLKPPAANALNGMWRRSAMWSGPQAGPRDGQGHAWSDTSFDDASWGIVALPDTLDGGVFGDRYYRAQFQWDGAAAVKISFSADDGLAIYVNGRQLGMWGNGWREAGCVNGPPECSINAKVPDVTVAPMLLQQGSNSIAVDVWNGACCGFNLDVKVSTSGGVTTRNLAETQTTQKTVMVAATAKPPLGIDAGIWVNAGDTMSFGASGNWCLGSPPVDQGYDCGDPRGWHIANAQETGALLSTAKLGTLIGTIGGTGRYFAIGGSNTLTAQDSGELYLLINDRRDYYFDNGGSVTVNVAVSSR